MNFHLKIDLYRLVDVYTNLPDGFFIEFRDIKNLQNWYDDEENVTKLEIEYYNNQIDLNVFLDDAVTRSYNFSNQDITDASYSGDYLIFDCFINDYHASQLKTLINLGVIRLNIDGYTYMYCYLQNSPNNVVSKSLTLVDVMQIKVNVPLGVKSFTFEWDYTITGIFNYVYFPDFFRYYYVNSVIVLTNKLFRYSLIEDVLMSHETVIRQQNAFVTRYAGSTNTDLVDSRFPLLDVPEIYILPVGETYPNPKINTELDFEPDYLDTPNILVSTKVKLGTPETYIDTTVEAPDNNLPDSKPHYSSQTKFQFLSLRDLPKLLFACLGDDATASYIDSILWLPFDPTTPFNLVTIAKDDFLIGEKKLKSDGSFVSYTTVLTDPDRVYCVTQNTDFKPIQTTPYLIIADFTFTHNENDWRDYEPYTNYEIYIAFVGWVKINGKDFIDDRCLIYYSLDAKTGGATAYLYNFDRKFIIWSGACQLGIKIDLTTSNLAESIKQKQSNDLNMILGLLTSALSIGVGVATENPVAIAGGILSSGKVVAENVNANRMIMNRAVTNLGSSDGAIYATKDILIKETRYLAVLNSDGEAIYNAMNGKPYNNYVSLSSLSGYTEIGDINFNPSNSLISQDEINEIVALLKNGVIL